MKQKPGWTYKYSEELGQMIARHDRSGWVYCSDGTKYSPEEIEIIRKHGLINKQVHEIKKAFDGEIIK